MGIRRISTHSPKEALSFLRMRGIFVEGGGIVINKSKTAFGLVSPTTGDKGKYITHRLPHLIRTEKFVLLVTGPPNLHEKASGVSFPTLVLPGEENYLTLRYRASEDHLTIEVPLWLSIIDNT